MKKIDKLRLQGPKLISVKKTPQSNINVAALSELAFYRQGTHIIFFYNSLIGDMEHVYTIQKKKKEKKKRHVYLAKLWHCNPFGTSSSSVFMTILVQTG